jgi:hypothetical protein
MVRRADDIGTPVCQPGVNDEGSQGDGIRSRNRFDGGRIRSEQDER